MNQTRLKTRFRRCLTLMTSCHQSTFQKLQNHLFQMDRFKKSSFYRFLKISLFWFEIRIDFELEWKSAVVDRFSSTFLASWWMSGPTFTLQMQTMSFISDSSPLHINVYHHAYANLSLIVYHSKHSCGSVLMFTRAKIQVDGSWAWTHDITVISHLVDIECIKARLI